ncbi:MAG: hypothetical protein Q4D71_08550 [Oscillospiraceae bacterium]|nr:hypothetical protein [Oscillospiraceae bacterium]
MITLTAIIIFVLFMKIVGFIFKAGFRILGWLFSGMGFLISVILAVSVIGIVFDVLPVLLILGVIMLARQPA